MIFNKFQETDIVTGRTTRVASGFWPNGQTNWSQSLFVDDFWTLTGSSATPSPAYGASTYDVRRTMYYVNVYPNATLKAQNDAYFSATYGHIAGSGSFNTETASIRCNPTKAIYTQYKNLLLGSTDLDGKFSFKTGSAGGTVDALDVFVLGFSTYKMKDRIDEGIFQISFGGTNGIRTYIDDSSADTQIKNVYNLISGSLETGILGNASYEGIGLLYPQNGIVVINAEKLNEVVGLKTANFNSDGNGPYNYNSSSFGTATYAQNAKVIVESIIDGGDLGGVENQIKIRKSEYVPARHYFVRVKNRDFNYSNNPTYVYDGTDGVHAKGTILNSDFVDDPRTYVTTVGLYNESNELVAVAKLSRPAVKSFDNEILIKVRLDF
jgi:hypothetical protein